MNHVFMVHNHGEMIAPNDDDGAVVNVNVKETTCDLLNTICIP